MKIKLVLAIAMTIATTLVNAEAVVHNVTANWMVIENIDEMDDSSKCLLAPTNFQGASIAFYLGGYSYHNAAAMAGVKPGSGVTWRVDKNEAVSYGRQRPGGETYLLTGQEYTDTVNAFKQGDSVVIRVYPENQFLSEETTKHSLAGFTKAFDEAVKCEF